MKCISVFFLTYALFEHAKSDLSIQQAVQLTLPAARAEPSLNVTRLVGLCRPLSPNNRSPRYGTEVFLQLSVDRFIGIDDVAEISAVSGSIEAIWTVQCPEPVPLSNLTSDRIMISKVNSIFKPAIGFRSSIDDIGMLSDLYYDRMEMYYNRSTANQLDLAFYWKRRGIFRSVCKLDLRKFPFDHQNCSFKFNLIEAEPLISFNLAQLTDSITYSDGDMWVYTKGSYRFASITPDGEDTVSQVTFDLTFKRQPFYFITNLLAPCLVLNFLGLVAFLIPPDNSDRLCFCVYLVLAFAVGQSQVLGSIPHTPQHVLLNDYIQLLALVASLCTIHAIIIFWFVVQFPTKANRFLCRKLKTSTFYAVLAFIVILLLLFGVNYWALSSVV